MSLALAVLLGILQGLTEFFPVSSSGHLALFGHWFGLEEPDLTFDILVHLATLGAILVYFRRDWIQLGQTLLGRPHDGDFPPGVWWMLLLSMLPAGIVGVFFKDHIGVIHGQPFWVGLCLLITGTLLLIGYHLSPRTKNLSQLTWTMVLLIGLAQAFAILPGISRAGSTIMVGLFLGLEQRTAARFSFLMAVPVIGGAGLLTLLNLISQWESLDVSRISAYLAGFIAALISGFFALAFLMRLLEGKRFFLFFFYCFGLGLIAMVH